MGKRVLIITYYWPPSGGSGVQRWEKFTKFLPENGWQPVIYTPENPNVPASDASLESDIPAGTEILKTRITEPSVKTNKEVNPINFQKKSLKQKLLLFVRGNFFIPDPKIGWVRPSVAFLKEYLERHPVDVVVSTGPPHSMHLIARSLMRELRKTAPAAGMPRWIADFRDPWTEMFYFKHLTMCRPARKAHRRLEQSVLDEADGIIVVTPSMQRDFQARTETPVHLITNGFDEDDFKGHAAPAQDGCFRLVHTGVFAADGNPAALWRALSEMCGRDERFRTALRIHLTGKVDGQIIEAIKDAGLEDKLELPGYLPHDKVVSEQLSAAVLLLALRQEPECAKVYTGKIFEYLATRRPILGIGESEGVAAELLLRTKSGKMFDWNDQRGISSFLEKHFDAFCEGRDLSNDNIDLSEFSRKTLTKKLCSILKSHDSKY